MESVRVVLRRLDFGNNSAAPFIIGKYPLEAFKIIEDHCSGLITIGISKGKPKHKTNKSPINRHWRIRLVVISERLNVAQALISQTISKKSGKELVEMINSKTYLHPNTVERLLKHAGKLDDAAAAHLKSIVSQCKTRLKSGEPNKVKKFSLSKFRREFNECIEIDVMYWGKKMSLHMIDTETAYSELVSISSRNLSIVLRELDNYWFLGHGCPDEVRADHEFDNCVLRKWMCVGRSL